MLQQDGPCKNPDVCDFHFPARRVTEHAVIIAQSSQFSLKAAQFEVLWMKLVSFKFYCMFVTFFSKYEMVNK